MIRSGLVQIDFTFQVRLSPLEGGAAINSKSNSSFFIFQAFKDANKFGLILMKLFNR
jgi:hypothetical protein